MTFWLGILVGGLFAWLGFKIGFYQTWAVLFNVVIAVYLAIFLGPLILEVIPGVSDTAYSTVLAVISTAIGTFLILQCLSYTFFTGQFNVSIPMLLDSLGAVLLGFLAGFLVWSFVVVLVSMTPLSQNSLLQGIGFGDKPQARQTHKSNICWWCNTVHWFVGKDDCAPEKTLDGLLEKARPAGKRTPKQPSDVNEPPAAGVDRKKAAGPTDKKSKSTATEELISDM
ncbi:MAG TPA: CvpA family protein [Sedimentisphaerales bacterium]|nr:CvpA family protein [Sedimentisphaerales bacterium]